MLRSRGIGKGCDDGDDWKDGPGPVVGGTTIVRHRRMPAHFQCGNAAFEVVQPAFVSLASWRLKSRLRHPPLGPSNRPHIARTAADRHNFMPAFRELIFLGCALRAKAIPSSNLSVKLNMRKSPAPECPAAGG